MQLFGTDERRGLFRPMKKQYLHPVFSALNRIDLGDIQWIRTFDPQLGAMNDGYCPIKLLHRDSRVATICELQELMKRIQFSIDFISSGGTYEAIELNPLDDSELATVTNAEISRLGFVYVMQNRRNGLFKIGFSKNPSFREKTLQSEEPEVEMIFAYKGSIEIEKKIHDRYSKKRIRGEWFSLREEDLASIELMIDGGEK